MRQGLRPCLSPTAPVSACTDRSPRVRVQKGLHTKGGPGSQVWARPGSAMALLSQSVNSWPDCSCFLPAWRLSPLSALSVGTSLTQLGPCTPGRPCVGTAPPAGWGVAGAWGDLRQEVRKEAGMKTEPQCCSYCGRGRLLGGFGKLETNSKTPTRSLFLGQDHRTILRGTTRSWEFPNH